MLSQIQEKQLIKLLYKVGDVTLGLPKPVFEALCKIVVFPSCEVVVVNKKKEVLMTFRQDDIWQGWHFPGRLIRYGQTFQQCLQKTATAELGCRLASSEFLFPMDYSKGLRGPAVSLVFLCKVKGQPKYGKFFKVMPANIILEHKPLWKRLKNWGLLFK